MLCKQPAELRGGRCSSRPCSWKVGAWYVCENQISGRGFIGLVIGCIEIKFCNKILVGKLLTRCTRFTCFCTVQASIFQKTILLSCLRFSFFAAKFSILRNFDQHLSDFFRENGNLKPPPCSSKFPNFPGIRKFGSYYGNWKLQQPKI